MPRAQAQPKGSQPAQPAMDKHEEAGGFGPPGRHQGPGLQSGFHAANTGCIWHAALISNAPQATAGG